MARALADILTELNSVYNPQRQAQTDIYNKGIESVAPQETADLSGLEVAKQNAFESINTGANRRGMYFSGIPLAEQGKYVGENYLPSIAGLKNRYAGIRGNLYQTLAQQLGELDTRQREFGQGIYNQEVQQDIERERIAEAARQAELDRQAAARASAGSGTSSGTALFRPTSTATTGAGTPTTAAPTQTYIGNNDYRGRLAYEASQGDKEATIALKYVGNDGNYDGPVSNIQELDTLRRLGITGNYYVPGLQTQSTVGGLEYL